MNLLFLGAVLMPIAFQSLAPHDQPSAANAVTVSGCVAQAQRTGSLAGDTPTGAIATPNTAGIEANSGEPLNAYVLLDASPVVERGERRGPRTTYTLHGHEVELATHKGHRVEIVGHLEDVPQETARPITTRRLAVDSIKMVSNQCRSAQPESRPR